MDNKKISQFLQNKGVDWIKWQRNTPAASHMGGVWERQIRSAISTPLSLLKTHSQSLFIILHGVSFRILCAPSIQASGISSSKLLYNSLHLSNESSDVSESSPSTFKILRQSLIPHYSKSSPFLTRQEDSVLRRLKTDAVLETYLFFLSES